MRLRVATVLVLAGLLHGSGASARSLQPRWNSFRFSNTVSIRYFTAGNGSQPVVLLHGLASSADTWKDMLGFLDCDCTFYALDLKGHGGSSAPEDHAYGIDDNAAIVRAFLDSHDLRNIILIGHSYGGAVAVRTAFDLGSEPDRVRGLVLLGTPATKQHFPLYMTALRHQRPATFFEKFTPPE